MLMTVHYCVHLKQNTQNGWIVVGSLVATYKHYQKILIYNKVYSCICQEFQLLFLYREQRQYAEIRSTNTNASTILWLACWSQRQYVKLLTADVPNYSFPRHNDLGHYASLSISVKSFEMIYRFKFHNYLVLLLRGSFPVFYGTFLGPIL